MLTVFFKLVRESEDMNNKNNIKVLAYYLPQFYPTKENDQWWGKGFTEWTNVGKAEKLWKKHYQPKVPADLGYYDLRLPSVREQQAELAREAGVSGFLYWHYWFGNGRRLLSEVFQEVLDSGKPDFPFALAWANHPWYKKSWASNTNSDELLLAQTYPGIDDAREHFEFLLKAFKDPRYIKIDGKPFLLIFHPKKLPDLYIRQFRKWTVEAGFKGLYLVANVIDPNETLQDYQNRGYEAVTYNNICNYQMHFFSEMNPLHRIVVRIYRIIKEKLTGMPHLATDYGKHCKEFISEKDKEEDVIPEIFPNWDHSPRSGRKCGPIFYNCEPKYFYEHVKTAVEAVKSKPIEKRILILKSWNEWGEGNYMEPDLKYGHGYIDALRRALDSSGDD